MVETKKRREVETMGWVIEKRNSDGSVVITNGEVSHVLVREANPNLIRESGWYILRTVLKNTLGWMDRARPGYGETYWINKGPALSLGLS